MAKRRRIQEVLDHMAEMWRSSRQTATDPGLRDRYHEFPRVPIRLVCPRLDKEVNQGNLLRTAEAFRLEKVFFGLSDLHWDPSGAMGAQVWQPFERVDPAEVILRSKSEGYRIYGLDLAPEATAIHRMDWQFPCALVVGEELYGLPRECRELCDEFIGIPLFGLMQSLNVVVATGICVQRMVETLALRDPAWRPAREVSRRLLD